MVPGSPEPVSTLSDTVTVTGAGGYLGGLLVRRLYETGRHDVRALSRNDAPWLPVSANDVDLADPDALEHAFAGSSAVVHLAGANETLAKADPERALVETVIASRRVAEACEVVGVPRIVYLSTVHVYGAALEPGAEITEDVAPQPRSDYAVARLASEHLVASTPASQVVVFRLTNAVGAPAAPGVDRWSLVANDLSRQAAVDGELVLRSDGRQWRDFVAVDDVCRIIEESLDEELVPPGTYNLGSGRPLTVLQLAEIVQDAADALTGERPRLRVPAPERAIARPYSVGVRKLAALGLFADTPIQDAITETVRFCLGQRVSLAGEEQV